MVNIGYRASLPAITAEAEHHASAIGVSASSVSRSVCCKLGIRRATSSILSGFELDGACGLGQPGGAEIAGHALEAMRGAPGRCEVASPQSPFQCPRETCGPHPARGRGWPARPPYPCRSHQSLIARRSISGNSTRRLRSRMHWSTQSAGGCMALQLCGHRRAASAGRPSMAVSGSRTAQGTQNRITMYEPWTRGARGYSP